MAQDYNQTDEAGVTAVMQHNAAQIAALTHLHNQGANVEVRNMARDMLAGRQRENATLHAFMARRGIATPNMSEAPRPPADWAADGAPGPAME